MEQASPRQIAAIIFLLYLSGCGRGDPAPVALTGNEQDLVGRIDASLGLAAKFLVSQQSSDGAWRSHVYGPLKDGPSLTPHVLASLYFLPQGSASQQASFRHGVEYLSTLLDSRGEVDAALRYPVYSAAEASWVVVLADPNEHGRLCQEAWINYLRVRQLNARLGWSESDPAFGGWGYSVAIPRKPTIGEDRDPLAESNISATVYGLGAMRCANISPTDPVYREVLTFVQRCQNYCEDAQKSDAAFDDGGFFFLPDDAARNKAGVAGIDRLGHTRFHSYGSATADGLRALLHAGLAADHPRVLAARRWLENHFDPASNPGVFERDREVLRDATYYYYAWSVAHAFMHLGVRRINTSHGPLDWAESLAAALLSRQRADGSWVNAYTDTKEDDPLVSTPSAAAALAICRKVIVERSGVPASACHHLPAQSVR